LKRSKTSPELGEHAIFGDEEAARLRSDLDELRGQFAMLTDQVNAQFTSIAAHAAIAREQVAVAREEGRADMERSRDTLIGLIEQVRAEAGGPGLRIPGSAPGPSVTATNERIASLEAAVEELAATVEDCFARQERMAETMSAFIDTLLSEQRGEPVAGLALT